MSILKRALKAGIISLILVLSACSESSPDRIIQLDAPPVFVIDELYEQCSKLQGSVEESAVQLIQHRAFRCTRGLYEGYYRCPGWSLRLVVTCATSSGTVELRHSYAWGNSEINPIKEISKEFYLEMLYD